MTNQMLDIAKSKDNGRFAKMGMKKYCAWWFGIRNPDNTSVEYLVDTYLECIDNINFEDWLKGNDYSRPVIFTPEHLQYYFSDLLSFSTSLNAIVDLFMYLYNQEFWIDGAGNCIYCTEYTLKERNKLNYVGIAMEYERLCTILEFEQLAWKDIDTMVECLYQYGYDIETDWEYLDENDVYATAHNIIDRLQQVFAL